MAAHSFDSSSPFPRRFDASVPTLLKARSIALTGPLPTSSVLHVAVAHLRGRSSEGDHDVDHSQHSLEARQEDDQVGPERRHVLVLTSDQAKWRDSLIRESDTSLFSTSSRSVDASFVSYLDRVEIKHLPTSEHILYFLTTVYSHAEHLLASQVFIESGTRSKSDPSYLPIVPTLVVLHNPSEYLAESQAQNAGIEAYTSLLALRPPLLVLFDNDALILEQALLAPHLAQPRRKRKAEYEERRFEQGEPTEERHIEQMRLLSVLPYFYDWVGIVEPGSSVFDSVFLNVTCPNPASLAWKPAVQQEPVPSQPSLTFVMTYTPSLHPSDIPSLLPTTSPTSRQPVAVEFAVQHLSQANGDDEDGLFVQVIS
ncbi:BZ3500_MvSof-1268-A1-R1_Chr1-3g02249 [Microbotryum saponariae]|uniref:BZ3500_MvSof-1268-A1-R1_Chr1-3g02249 protein n=1 Tax=Microbotryum saponariae TaxID=289078 RepID=A0A2X0KS78_9BASI|nr:BZ3500_MvSof-1268-A1-R1_Chr1-3g02249 [Microbotryum saponariae]SCZ95777.1 BZ3501_MvSof-1269-A2-R1_Chr1-3g01852 [Microbotryum saponariae]